MREANERGQTARSMAHRPNDVEPRLKRTWLWGLSFTALIASLVLARTALAADGNCPNGLPFCFAGNTPAVASQINHDLAQLKEWLEAKVGTVGQPVTIAGASTFNNSATFANQVTASGTSSFSGSTTLSGTTTLSGPTTISGATSFTNTGTTSFAGPIARSGYQVSCAGGAGGFMYPYCCRINVRDGSASCRIATGWGLGGWTSTNVVDPFTATTPGEYSISCYAGVSGNNFPSCCRSSSSGGVTCRVANAWDLSSWSNGASPF